MARLRRRMFLLTGFPTERKIELSQKIRKLGAIYSDSQNFQVVCTHIVCSQPSRSEKYLGGLATGKWLLTAAYVDYSHVAGQWLAEEDYEWDPSKQHLVPNPQIRAYLTAAPKWRKWVQETSLGAFVGWRAAILVENLARKSVYKSLLQHGSADVVNIKLPISDPSLVASSITHVFVEDKLVDEVASLIELGVLCLQPLYIGAYLLQDPPPDPMEFRATAKTPAPCKTPQQATTTAPSSVSAASRQRLDMSVNIDGSLLATPTATAPRTPVAQIGRITTSDGRPVPIPMMQVPSQTPSTPLRSDAACQQNEIVASSKVSNVQSTPTQRNTQQTTGEQRNSPLPTPRRKKSRPGAKNKGTPDGLRQQGLQKWLVRTPKTVACETPQLREQTSSENKTVVIIDDEQQDKKSNSHTTENNQNSADVPVIDLTLVDKNANMMKQDQHASGELTARSKGMRVAPVRAGRSQESTVGKVTDASVASNSSNVKPVDLPLSGSDEIRRSKRARQAPDKFSPAKNFPGLSSSQSSSGSEKSESSLTIDRQKSISVCGTKTLNVKSNLVVDKAAVRTLMANAAISAAKCTARTRSPPDKYSPAKQTSLSKSMSSSVGVTPASQSLNSKPAAEGTVRPAELSVPAHRSTRKRSAPDKFSPSSYERPISERILTKDSASGRESPSEHTSVSSHVAERTVKPRRLSVSITPVESSPDLSLDGDSPLPDSFILTPRKGGPGFNLTPREDGMSPVPCSSDQDSPVIQKAMTRSTQSVSQLRALGDTSIKCDAASADAANKPSQDPQQLKRKLSIDVPASSCKRVRYNLNDAIPVTTGALAFDLDTTHRLKPCLPLSDGHVCISNFEACMEENRKMFALDVLHSFVSSKCCPPPHTLHTVIVDILLESTDLTLSQKAYNLLGRILERHPPLSSARQLTYLHALQPGGAEGASGAPWAFVHLVISDVLMNSCEDEEDDSGDDTRDGLVKDTEDSEQSLRPQNAWFCLQFLVALLEVDFKHTVMRCGQANKSLVLSVITNVKHQRQLIASLIAATHAKSLPAEKMDVVRHLQSLVAMVAEASHLLHSKPGGPLGLNLPATSYAFASEYAYFIKGDLEEDMESLQLLVELSQPRWLTLLICSVLINELYEDTLVPDLTTSRGAPVSLRQILHRYFYLLPPMKSMTPTTPLKSPHVKGSQTRNNRRGSKAMTQSPLSTPQKLGRLDPLTKRQITSINKRNLKGETTLHTACIKNNITRVQQLLTVPGINVNTKDNYGWTPLHEACNHGHLECVKLLLDYAPPKTIDSYFIKGGSQDGGGVDLLAANDDGTTPLHDAVETNHTDVAMLLIQRGGSKLLEAKTKDGQRPIDLAMSEEMITALKNPSGSGGRSGWSQNSSESQGSGFQDSQGSSVDGNIPVPDEALYDQVLGAGGHITGTNIHKYLFLLLHTVTSYFTVHGAEAIRKELRDLNTTRHLKKYVKHLESHLRRIAEPGTEDVWCAFLESLYVLAESLC